MPARCNNNSTGASIATDDAVAAQAANPQANAETSSSAPAAAPTPSGTNENPRSAHPGRGINNLLPRSQLGFPTTFASSPSSPLPPTPPNSPSDSSVDRPPSTTICFFGITDSVDHSEMPTRKHRAARGGAAAPKKKGRVNQLRAEAGAEAAPPPQEQKAPAPAPAPAPETTTSRQEELTRYIRSLPTARLQMNPPWATIPRTNLTYDMNPGDNYFNSTHIPIPIPIRTPTPTPITAKTTSTKLRARVNTGTMSNDNTMLPGGEDAMDFTMDNAPQANPGSQAGGGRRNTRSQARPPTSNVHPPAPATTPSQAGGATKKRKNVIVDDDGMVHTFLEGVNYSENFDDWPANAYTSLEEYITNQGVWDEPDRLFMMGVQAGIGMGIHAHKGILTSELESTGKLWAKKVVFPGSDMSDKGHADSIRATTAFEILAGMSAANEYIATRNELEAHAKEIALIRDQAVRQTPTGPGGACGLDPNHARGLAPSPVVMQRSWPTHQGSNIPNETADLTAMAGTPTIGGLDVSRVDGFAGALANSVQQPAPRYVVPASRQPASNVNTGNNSYAVPNVPLHGFAHPDYRAQASGYGVPVPNTVFTDPRHPPMPRVSAPTLSETQNGRAVIKLFQGEKNQPK
ncbi:hypothetical protein SCUP234_03500 [Seiridium cupressi]